MENIRWNYIISPNDTSTTPRKSPYEPLPSKTNLVKAFNEAFQNLGHWGELERVEIRRALIELGCEGVPIVDEDSRDQVEELMKIFRIWIRKDKEASKERMKREGEGVSPPPFMLPPAELPPDNDENERNHVRSGRMQRRANTLDDS